MSGNVKINTADRWFSKCVRERNDWKCQGCGKQYDPSSTGLHCSHYYGRRNTSVRYDPLNAFAHCYGCHQRYGSNPEDFHEHYLDTYGKGALEIVKEKRTSLYCAKENNAKRFMKDIAYHYREEHKRMLRDRASGKTGWVEFTGWT